MSLLHVPRFMHLIDNLNSFLASSDFCRQLITFAISLDPDQDRYSLCPDLNSTCFPARLTL